MKDETTAPLQPHRLPWYFELDELIHRLFDRPLGRWKFYWDVRHLLCNYVDRRLGVTEEEMGRK